MQLATPGPRAEGLTPSRLSAVGGAKSGGVSGSHGASGSAASRELDLLKACFVAVTAGEKAMEDTVTRGLAGSKAAGTGGGSSGRGTPTPPDAGAGAGHGHSATEGVPAAPSDGRGPYAGDVLGGRVSPLGFCRRVEEGLTAFLVLAMSVLRWGVPSSHGKPWRRRGVWGVCALQG